MNKKIYRAIVTAILILNIKILIYQFFKVQVESKA